MSEVVTAAALRLGDASKKIWSLAELQRYCKDGYDELCRETLCLWDQAYINDRDGQSDYVLPTDFIAADRATWNAKPMRQLTQARMRQLDHQYRNEDSTTGEPQSYYLEGTGTLRKHPVPNATITSTAITFPTTEVVLNFRLEYFRLGADLASNVFEIPDSWTVSVRHYVMAQAYGRHGDGYNKRLRDHFQARWMADLGALKAAKSHMVASRMVIAGSRGLSSRGRRPPTPKLPWEYGRTVRG
jgi:hypothetical protein